MKMQITDEVLSSVGSLNITEDNRQDLYVKVLEYKGTRPDNMQAWIHTLYTNMVRDNVRKTKRRAELSEIRSGELRAVMGDDDISDPVEYVESEEIHRKLSALSSTLRNTLIAVHLKGDTPEEYAASCGVDPSVIYTRLSRAKKALYNT